MSNLFSTQGRLNRQSFFLTVITVVLSSWALTSMLFITMAMAGMPPDAARVAGFMVIVCAMIAVAFLIVRRLHDLDKPDWQYFLMLIPLYNFYLAMVLLFVKGSTGQNQYGEDSAAA